MDEFLRATEIVDHEERAVRNLANELAGADPPDVVVERCFHWVRDRIRHSLDHGDQHVTVSASEVLRLRTGMCYAKSHLLAALLRANNIPCGFVYQRLAQDTQPTTFCLHGLNAVWLAEYGWHRIDARGNRPGIVTRFDPPQEFLAFESSIPGEGLLEEVFADPLPTVVTALQDSSDTSGLCAHLPDQALDTP